MGYKNLLKETIEFLNENGETWDDVDYVVCQDFGFTKEKAAEMLDFMYDSGFGSQEVDSSLKIVGRENWWIERHEYDGCEWWEFKEKPSPGKPYGYQFKTFAAHDLYDEPEDYADYIGG